MKDLEKLAEQGFFEKLLGKRLGRLRKNQLLNAKKKILSGQMNTWAYPWGYSRHVNMALACVPAKSLIRNIGFGDGATHTTGGEDNVQKQDINTPLTFNLRIQPDSSYDYKFITTGSIFKRIARRLIRVFSTRTAG